MPAPTTPRPCSTIDKLPSMEYQLIIALYQSPNDKSQQRRSKNHFQQVEVVPPVFPAIN